MAGGPTDQVKQCMRGSQSLFMAKYKKDKKKIYQSMCVTYITYIACQIKIRMDTTAVDLHCARKR